MIITACMISPIGQSRRGGNRRALRINRGGSYIDFGKHLRSAYRSVTNPIDPDPNLGFRIARNAEAGNDTVTTTYLFVSVCHEAL